MLHGLPNMILYVFQIDPQGKVPYFMRIFYPYCSSSIMAQHWLTAQFTNWLLSGLTDDLTMQLFFVFFVFFHTFTSTGFISSTHTLKKSLSIIWTKSSLLEAYQEWPPSTPFLLSQLFSSHFQCMSIILSIFNSARSLECVSFICTPSGTQSNILLFLFATHTTLIMKSSCRLCSNLAAPIGYRTQTYHI